MSSLPRIGLWLVGARGNVAVTTLVGLAALRRGLAPTTGLVTALPELAQLPLVDWSSWVVGGHDLVTTPLADRAMQLGREGVLPLELAAAVAPDLQQMEAEIKPGVALGSGPAVLPFATAQHLPASPRVAIDRLRDDLLDFRHRHQLDRVVVVLLTSTEPPTDVAAIPITWPALAAEIDRASLRASTIYALAAIEADASFVNFTPSQGAALAAVVERARQRGVCLAGRDGKTGETLLKTVLAPLFALRNLRVQSWVGHNLLGNGDGAVLADPEHKQSKTKTKDAVLAELLGYAPQTLVSIEHIASLGDWKTAWDHVHFEGFLGVRMSLQFTWQGCDSALAAPLVLDLARLVELAARDGQQGELAHLACFFKSPVACADHDFARQCSMLLAWAAARGA